MSPSLEVASSVFDWANIFFLCSLVVGIVCTFAIVKMGRVKEHHWDVLREEQQLRIADLKVEAERLRAANLAFEVAVTPRILEQRLTGEQLKPFADISVGVVSPSDFEPRRTAGQIRYMLLMEAGWKKLANPLVHAVSFFDGVVVHGIAGVEAQRSSEAAKALVVVLKEAGIEARTGYPIGALGPLALLVAVGPKPLPPALHLKPETLPADAAGTRVWGNILAE